MMQTAEPDLCMNERLIWEHQYQYHYGFNVSSTIWFKGRPRLGADVSAFAGLVESGNGRCCQAIGGSIGRLW